MSETPFKAPLYEEDGKFYQVIEIPVNRQEARHFQKKHELQSSIKEEKGDSFLVGVVSYVSNKVRKTWTVTSDYFIGEEYDGKIISEIKFIDIGRKGSTQNSKYIAFLYKLKNRDGI